MRFLWDTRYGAYFSHFWIIIYIFISLFKLFYSTGFVFDFLTQPIICGFFSLGFPFCTLDMQHMIRGGVRMKHERQNQFWIKLARLVLKFYWCLEEKLTWGTLFRCFWHFWKSLLFLFGKIDLQQYKVSEANIWFGTYLKVIWPVFSKPAYFRPGRVGWDESSSGKTQYSIFKYYLSKYSSDS